MRVREVPLIVVSTAGSLRVLYYWLFSGAKLVEVSCDYLCEENKTLYYLNKEIIGK